MTETERNDGFFMEFYFNCCFGDCGQSKGNSNRGRFVCRQIKLGNGWFSYPISRFPEWTISPSPCPILRIHQCCRVTVFIPISGRRILFDRHHRNLLQITISWNFLVAAKPAHCSWSRTQNILVRSVPFFIATHLYDSTRLMWVSVYARCLYSYSSSIDTVTNIWAILFTIKMF